MSLFSLSSNQYPVIASDKTAGSTSLSSDIILGTKEERTDSLNFNSISSAQEEKTDLEWRVEAMIQQNRECIFTPHLIEPVATRFFKTLDKKDIIGCSAPQYKVIHLGPEGRKKLAHFLQNGSTPLVAIQDDETLARQLPKDLKTLVHAFFIVDYLHEYKGKIGSMPA